MTKVVLTGGPSGGKTTLAQLLQKEFSSRLFVCPEAASIVYGGGWPRRKNQVGVQFQQRAIYYLQRELEGLIASENQERVIICDRGSLDGIAYWPGPGPGTDFLDTVFSSVETEVARYDWVIHLDTAPLSYYDQTNPLRNESFEEAWKLNESIKLAWSAHPRQFIITNSESEHFLDKMQKALFVVERIIEGDDYEDIKAKVQTKFS
ncbi:MAG: ATP-binding protein [Bdellovibrionota bacterium]